MKSHSNSSPWAATFCLQILRAVLADEPDAGLGERAAAPSAATYLIAASTCTSRPGLATAGQRGGDLRTHACEVRADALGA